MITTATPEAVIRELIDVGFNRGDLAALADLVAPDSVEHQVGSEGGIDGVRALITELRTAIPDLHLVIEDVVTDGDKVWVRMRSTGTNTGPMRGRPPSGRPVEVNVFDIVRVVDGRIVEHWGVADRLAMLQQMGVPVGGPPRS